MISTLQPDEFLTDWRDYGLPCQSQPQIIRELGGGLSNRSFLVQADEQRWVLRLDSPGAEALGVDREREYQIHQLAAEVGLAPTCVRADRQLGFFITQYIEKELIFTPTRKSEQLDGFYTFFSRLHNLNLDLPSFDYAAQLQRLSGLRNLPNEILSALEILRAHPRQGICHHDPNPNNVLFLKERVMMLDWEYAAVGKPILDLAGLVHEWSLSPTEVSAKFDTDCESLQAAVTLYAAMSRYWTLEMKRLRSA